MKNRVTLDDLAGMAINDADMIPPDQLHALAEDLEAEKKRIKAAGDKLNTILLDRYSDKAAAMRTKIAKQERGDGQTGRVSFEDDDFTIRCDRPKKVEWDQERLSGLWAMIETEWKENPGEYIEVEYKVSEAKYKAWPGMIRKLFEPARTFSAGKESIKIERKGEG